MRRFAMIAFATLSIAPFALASTASADDEIDDDIRVEGSTITFGEIEANQDGYIVVHAVENGLPVVPGSLGHAPVKKGENRNVTVTVGAPLTPGARYTAMLHAETNGNGVYDFGPGSTDVDTPVLDDGKPEMETFTAPAS